MAATHPSHPARQWIDDPAALRNTLAQWADQPVVGVDTEFVRERTFWPQVALVQLSVPGQVLLVDPLVPGMPGELVPLLRDPGKLKVMHSASEDLQVFKTACDAVPSPLFDTQVAAALAGLGTGVGYQKLVASLTGTELEKGETRSNWLLRPLSERQLDYAADDVTHLHELHGQLSGQLEELGRQGWLQEDCARAVAAADADARDPWPHLSMRSAQTLDAEGQARLRRLLVWRDEQARRADRPRSWIIDNELVVTLARRVPVDQAAFARLLDGQARSPRQLRGPLWEVASAPLEDSDRELPLAPAQDASQRALVKRLQERVAGVAEAAGIPDGVLASRRQIELLLATGDWDAAFGGWRRELLEPALAAEIASGG